MGRADSRRRIKLWYLRIVFILDALFLFTLIAFRRHPVMHNLGRMLWLIAILAALGAVGLWLFPDLAYRPRHAAPPDDRRRPDAR